MVCSGFLYSYLSFRMCNANAKIGLFIVIYLVFWRCSTSIILPVWSTYKLLHVLHRNLYIPLELTMLSGILSYNWLCIILQVQNATFKSLPLKKLLTLCMSGLWYVFFHCVCLGVLSVFCVLSISLFLKLWMMENHYF
jgi:hypothetical protein